MKMMKNNIIGICILFLLVGCVKIIQPLDTNIEIIGNAQRFHTDFTKSNNSINITIKQEPSRLIYFPIDSNLLDEQGIFKIKCFDSTYNKVFEDNLTKIYYEGGYLERQVDYNTIIKYPIMQHIKLFDINKLNFSRGLLNCRISSDFALRYIEFIDGIQVEDTTSHCNWFWYDFEDFYIDCRDYPQLRCSYKPSSREQDEFLFYPSVYIMNHCFLNYEKT